MTSIQTCGSHDSMTDEFTFSMVFGDNPALTFEGMTREQIEDLRDCLDSLLWHERDSTYAETLDEMRMAMGAYVSVRDEEEVAERAIATLREVLLRKVDFDNGEDPAGTLHWPEVEAMLTRPLDYD